MIIYCNEQQMKSKTSAYYRSKYRVVRRRVSETEWAVAMLPRSVTISEAKAILATQLLGPLVAVGDRVWQHHPRYLVKGVTGEGLRSAIAAGYINADGTADGTARFTVDVPADKVDRFREVMAEFQT